MRLALAIVIAACAVVAARAEPVKIPLNVIEAASKQLPECDEDIKNEERDGDDLGRGLQLVQVRCWRAAYQAGSILFAVDPNAPDKARLLRFQSWNGKKFDWTYSLTDADYDSKTRTLSMRHKGRGIGDCGVIGEWQWNGADFKLTGFWNKPKCDGKEFDSAARWRIYPSRR